MRLRVAANAAPQVMNDVLRAVARVV